MALGIDLLSGPAGLVEVEESLPEHGQLDPEHSSLPVHMKDRLVLLLLDSPEAVHAFHMVNTVQ
jgi:hypothetical protein